MNYHYIFPFFLLFSVYAQIMLVGRLKEYLNRRTSISKLLLDSEFKSHESFTFFLVFCLSFLTAAILALDTMSLVYLKSIAWESEYAGYYKIALEIVIALLAMPVWVSLLVFLTYHSVVAPCPTKEEVDERYRQRKYYLPLLLYGSFSVGTGWLTFCYHSLPFTLFFIAIGVITGALHYYVRYHHAQLMIVYKKAKDGDIRPLILLFKQHSYVCEDFLLSIIRRNEIKLLSEICEKGNSEMEKHASNAIGRYMSENNIELIDWMSMSPPQLNRVNLKLST